MVSARQWILENNPNARVAVITDRDELDKQIEGVLKNAGVVPETDEVRANSGRDLMSKLGQARPPLLCSLVHKFGKQGKKNDKEFEQFIKEVAAQPSQTVGEIFVFVDECHRTESGRLNQTMKAIMKNAVFIGFTGTPLLKADKKTSLWKFSAWLRPLTKFGEAVEDKVVLDLIYEAHGTSTSGWAREKIDAWFRGLEDEGAQRLAEG